MVQQLLHLVLPILELVLQQLAPELGSKLLLRLLV
jgi:hypothetical protein